MPEPTPPPSRPQASATLLAFTVTVLTLLALEFGTLLDPFSWWHDKEIQQSAERDRYLNHRLLTALESFQYGITPTAEAAISPETWQESELLDGVPSCAIDWSRTHGQIERWHADMLGRKLDTTPLSTRMTAQLDALDTYLSLKSEAGNRNIESNVMLDRQRWLEAVRTSLTRSFSPPEFPGTRLQTRCSDFRDALRTLLPTTCRQTLLAIRQEGASDAHRDAVRIQCRALENLAWHDTTSKQQLQNWLPGQIVAIPKNLIEQHNPWGGSPGCIFLKSSLQLNQYYYLSDIRKSNRSVCEHPEIFGYPVDKTGKSQLTAVSGTPSPSALDDPAWAIPPSLALMLKPLETLRQPTGTLYKAFTNRSDTSLQTPERYGTGPNQASIGGAKIDIGFSSDLTINPQSQAIAQQVVACYTGNQKVCQMLRLTRPEDGQSPIGHNLLENALVRVAGIAVIDIRSGRIEALAGALSPCARQDFDGPGRSADCDNRLPWKPVYRPDSLENPAVFLDAMPASTVKPLMATAFLTDGNYGAALLARENAARLAKTFPQADTLRRQLARSDSTAFLDRMFCADQGYHNCERPWTIQRTARLFGWNSDCEPGSASCGRHDLLFGRSPSEEAENGLVIPLSRQILFGRLLTTSLGKGDPRFGEMPRRQFDEQVIKACADGADALHRTKDDWGKCRGGDLVNMVAEGWGQGHARVTPLGVAGMMAVLGAAANGESEIIPPHLVERVHGIKGEVRLAHQRYGLDKPEALKIPRTAAEVVLDGLTYSHRKDGTAASACRQVFSQTYCNEVDWVAGKTGTPTFPNDNKTLDEISKACEPQSPRSSGQADRTCLELRPYKWYTAVFRSHANGKDWDKAIAVLTERNWLKKEGTVHGAGDYGPNPAAEIGFQVLGRIRGAITHGTGATR